jgi:ERCC4-type nuclease
MTSLSLFEGFSVFRTSTVQETADLLIHMATKLSRDMFVKKPFRHLAHQLPQPLSVLKKRSSYDNDNNNNNKDTHKDNNDDDGGLQEPETKTEGGGGEGETNDNNNISSYSSFVKKVKKENITDENIGVIMLTQIPGVSAPVAEEIFKERTLSELIQWCKTDPEHALTDIKVKTATNRSMKLKCNVRQAIIHYLQKL